MNSQHIQAAIGRAIKHYMPDDVTGLTDTDANAGQLDVPYFSITPYGQPERASNDPQDPRVFVHFQVLAVTQGGTSEMNPNAKFRCIDLADYLRTCLFYEQNLVDLRRQGIIPSRDVQAVPTTSIYLGNFNQFQAGALYSVVVWDDKVDPSRTSSIKYVKTKFSRKTIRKDDH